MLVFEFTHSAILCRQRVSEYKESKQRVHCCCDVVLGFAMPIFTVCLWCLHLVQAEYFERLFSGAGEPVDVNYMFQWMALPVLVMYFSGLGYLFWRDSALDELQDYVAVKVCCF